MFAAAHLERWWVHRLSDNQRAQLKRATQTRVLDTPTVDLLLDTRCPVGPIGSKWEADLEWTWNWAFMVRDFVTAQVQAVDG